MPKLTKTKLLEIRNATYRTPEVPIEPDKCRIRELESRLAAVEADLADSNLLLGDGWKEVIRRVNGEIDVPATFQAQCAKLAGDVGELEDRLEAAERERDAGIALLESDYNQVRIGEELVWKETAPGGCVAWFFNRLGTGSEPQGYYRPLDAIRAALAAEGR